MRTMRMLESPHSQALDAARKLAEEIAMLLRQREAAQRSCDDIEETVAILADVRAFLVGGTK